jgi:hypothetical protein
MSGVKLPGCFKKCAEGGGRSGVDFGFLSTTTNELVAVSYLGGKEMPVLFQFDVGDIDRGASLSFLSQYPNLSYLEVTGEPFSICEVIDFKKVRLSLSGSCLRSMDYLHILSTH